jgi:hypothetical protein
VLPGDLDYRYDRRADEHFLRLFEAQGLFRTVTEYARKARYPIDLQFLRNPKTSAQHASVYVGLTTVLDIHWKPGKVKLAAHPTWQLSGFDPGWASWTSIDDLGAWIDAVEVYLDAVIPKAAAGSAAVEGAVQAAVSSFASDRLVMLDREVQLHFRDMPTKQRVLGEVSADLLSALGSAPVSGSRPVSFGGECDLLAVDRTGRLRAVEVKPRGVSSIVWAPAQTIVYARLLSKWRRHDPDAVKIVDGMIEQRSLLNLVSDRPPAPSDRPEVVPMLAIQRGMPEIRKSRMVAVMDHLTREGIAEARELIVYEVTLAGRLLRLR